jgi:hypothetical protein
MNGANSKPYKERIRFAYFPVRLWANPRPFTRKLNVWIWWCDVYEIQTIFGEWVAYIGHQSEEQVVLDD